MALTGVVFSAMLKIRLIQDIALLFLFLFIFFTCRLHNASTLDKMVVRQDGRKYLHKKSVKLVQKEE